MKCARLNLQDRAKTAAKRPQPTEKPKRYCQRVMVNPENCEDPRWTDAIQRFHCKSIINVDEYVKEDTERTTRNEEDLYLTVQNLKFQGNVPDVRRPRTSFKYKSLTGDRKHRMFVKQVVEENYNYEEDSGSQLANYFDDYVKYVLSIDRSRPSSSKSSTHKQSDKLRETSTQVEIKPDKINIKPAEEKPKRKNIPAKVVKYDIEEIENNPSDNNDIDDAKVAYHKSGKRKSLTISRVPSPETVQVIRVDVVCNYSSSSISDAEDKKLQADVTKLSDKEIAKLNFRGSHFADKYLLAKTIKSVDENLACGSKVTLLCKTFKLSDRNKFAGKRSKKLVNDVSVMNKIKQCAH